VRGSFQEANSGENSTAGIKNRQASNDFDVNCTRCFRAMGRLFVTLWDPLTLREPYLGTGEGGGEGGVVSS
jgi:hypothetical protein